MTGYKKCVICGKTFYTTSGTKKYCGPVCKAKAKSMVDKKRLENLKQEDWYLFKKVGKEVANKNIPAISIEEIARKASEMGLSYGAYVSKYSIQ